MYENQKFSFEGLEVYRCARELVKGIYILQNKFPKEEKYALGDQIRRSATSITSNIAEGSGRSSIREKIHFIEIAFGSMTESFSQLQNAQDLGYLLEADIDKLRPLYSRVAALLSNLRKSFERRIQD
ncbi:MAG: four helix bundle protein [Bacteroidaceae bacterium]|nr:four helix bundle protein [Bacteroidaceae bacterium]